MSLCESISVIATEVEKQLVCLSQSHKNMLTVMRNLPLYYEKKNLAGWEADYRASMLDTENELSKNYKAIDLVYEIISLNLFGEFQIEETKKIYSFSISELKKLGINVSNNLNVEQW